MNDWLVRLQRWFGNDPSTAASVASDPADEIIRGAPPSVDVQKLVQAALSTNPDEIGCDEFFEQMDRFVELSLEGHDVAVVMPLMQDHLERCRDCREEYDALRRALEIVA